MDASKDPSVAVSGSEYRLNHSRISRKFPSMSMREEREGDDLNDHNNPDFTSLIVSDDILTEQLYTAQGGMFSHILMGVARHCTLDRDGGVAGFRIPNDDEAKMEQESTQVTSSGSIQSALVRETADRQSPSNSNYSTTNN